MRAVALLQLPIPDPDPALAVANVPLAAGYLKACLPPEQREAIRIPPRELARYGGDGLILDWLAAQEPALAGFSCYLWNLERSLWLAARLKERVPSARVVFGGPEIVEGRPLLDSRAVDAFVQGEGEPVFEGLLEALDRAQGPGAGAGSGGAPAAAAAPPLPRFTRAGLAALAGVPNPYACGALEARPDEPLYLETLRGCPHRCSYCFYGKQFPSVRRFPPDFLPAVFALAAERGVPEIYLMDPSFTSARGLEQRLARLASLNPAGIPLHAELRLEALSPQAARLMREAGFASVEAGLQSVNREALAGVGRDFRPEAFLRGAGLLQAQGVAIRTGVILGLPGDTLEGFAATLEFLRGHGLAAGAEIYPLAVLPGTALREQAAQLGLSYMPSPPYWVLSTPALSETDLFRAVRLAEEVLEGELFAPLVPRFADPAPGITGFLDLRGGSPAASLASLELLERGVGDPLCLRLAGSVTLLLSGAQLSGAASLDDLRRLGERLVAANPFSLFQLVIEGAELPPLEPALRLAEAFHRPGNYFDRSRYYQEDPQGRFSARLYHLTADPAAARRHCGEPLPLELILAFSPRLLSTGRDLLEEHPLLLLERPLRRQEQREIEEIYDGRESLLIRPGPQTARISSAMKA
jgi:hypothetical protein